MFWAGLDLETGMCNMQPRNLLRISQGLWWSFMPPPPAAKTLAINATEGAKALTW